MSSWDIMYKLGYFAQNQAEYLDGKKTVLDTMIDEANETNRSKVRDILGAFLFRGEAVEKYVSVLSGGERNRLALAKLLLKPLNVLVMDEPTNHLDIQSKNVLKSALHNFEGTLLLVSHDREFLQGLNDIVYEFKDQILILIFGASSDIDSIKSAKTSPSVLLSISAFQFVRLQVSHTVIVVDMLSSLFLNLLAHK